jgi:hypothetical protein
LTADSGEIGRGDAAKLEVDLSDASRQRFDILIVPRPPTEERRTIILEQGKTAQ